MSPADNNTKKIEQTIREFDRQIEVMHLNVQRYLSDRSKYPHPRHEEFTQKILLFQIRGLKVRSLELKLENVQYKAINRSKIWKQWFQDDAKGIYLKGKRGDAKQEVNKVSDTYLDKLYERVKETWTKFGIEDIELKKDFMERILPSYSEARKNLKKDQRLVFTYDKKTHRVQVKVL